VAAPMTACVDIYHNARLVCKAFFSGMLKYIVKFIRGTSVLWASPVNITIN